MAARPRLPGYVRRPGSRREYVTPEGEVISYRQYRKSLEAAGAVRHLEAADLANVRRRQEAFNRIIDQMARVRREAIEAQIEAAEEIGEEEEADELREELRYVRRTAIRSPSRKQALSDLRRYAHQWRDPASGRVYSSHEAARRAGVRNPVAERSSESEERTREALKVLGRREGIPDWVPVGASDRFRAGRIRRTSTPAHQRRMLRTRGRSR